MKDPLLRRLIQRFELQYTRLPRVFVFVTLKWKWQQHSMIIVELNAALFMHVSGIERGEKCK